MRLIPRQKFARAALLGVAASAAAGISVAAAAGGDGAAVGTVSAHHSISDKSTVARAKRGGATMLQNQLTKKCLKGSSKDLWIAKCNRNDPGQYFGRWGTKMFGPSTGCVSAKKSTWDVRVEECDAAKGGYGLSWWVSWDVRTYRTVWNTKGCFLDAQNAGNSVRCAPRSQRSNQQWRSGYWS